MVVCVSQSGGYLRAKSNYSRLHHHHHYEHIKTDTNTQFQRAYKLSMYENESVLNKEIFIVELNLVIAKRSFKYAIKGISKMAESRRMVNFKMNFLFLLCECGFVCELYLHVNSCRHNNCGVQNSHFRSRKHTHSRNNNNNNNIQFSIDLFTRYSLK